MKNFSSLVNLFQINVGMPRILAELEEKKMNLIAVNSCVIETALSL